MISSKTHKEEFEKIEKLSNLSKKFHSPKKRGNITIIKLIDNSIESKFNDQTNKNLDSIINNDSNLKENLESTETNELKTNEIQTKDEKIIDKEENANNNQENNNVDQDVYINIQVIK